MIRETASLVSEETFETDQAVQLPAKMNKKYQTYPPPKTTKKLGEISESTTHVCEESTGSQEANIQNN